MEVAVSKSDWSTVRFIKGSVVLVALVLGAAGCSDMNTYTHDSQNQGMRLYKQGNYADAAGAFRNAARQNPRSYQSYYYMGACYEQMGQYQQAIASYKTARQTMSVTLEGREDHEFRQTVLNGLANAVARSDQRDAEINSLQRDAQDHQTAEPWYLLAKVYALRGDADSAIDAYNRAALLEPNNFAVAKEYGLYLEHMGQKQRAEVPLRRAYALNDQDAQVNAALRRIGVVPGPSIREENQLAKPMLPKGPIPEMHIPGMGGDSSSPGSTVQAPRD